MKTSMTGAAILATLATSAVAEGVSSASFAVEVLSKDDGCSLGYLWSEKKEANFPDPQYGDAQYDLMFKKQNGNHQTIHLEDLYNPQGSSAWMNCGYPRPPFESCTGIMLSVNGGEWESGHYLVDAKFRYEMEPELGFSLNNYSKETGIADFEYSGPNHKYSFYACGDAPANEGDDASGDLVIKYADEPTPSECQDVRLQVQLMKDLDNFEPVQLCEFTGCSTA